MYVNGGSTEYRRTTIYYKTDAVYLNRHIVGLPSETIVSDPAQNFYRVKWKSSRTTSRRTSTRPISAWSRMTRQTTGPALWPGGVI